MAPFRRIGWSLTLALVAAGCGASRPFVSQLRIETSAPVRLVGAVPPRSSGPGLGPAHPFFLDGRHGYVATTGGAWYVPKTGIQPPVVPAEIDVTRDGGRTWRTLRRERHAAFDAIAFSGRYGYALGSRLVPGLGWPLSVRTFALATSDAGLTWRRASPTFASSDATYPTQGDFPVAVQ